MSRWYAHGKFDSNLFSLTVNRRKKKNNNNMFTFFTDRSFFSDLLKWLNSHWIIFINIFLFYLNTIAQCDRWQTDQTYAVIIVWMFFFPLSVQILTVIRLSSTWPRWTQTSFWVDLTSLFTMSTLVEKLKKKKKLFRDSNQ